MMATTPHSRQFHITVKKSKLPDEAISISFHRFPDIIVILEVLFPASLHWLQDGGRKRLNFNTDVH